MTDLLTSSTWSDVDRAARRALLVPLGSVEQHGPHLPLGTDTIIAEAVARQTAARRSGIAVAPALAYGASGEHAAFPGTLSIGTQALAHVLVELGRDGSRDWPAVMFVNAHGGNRDALSAAIGRLVEEGRRCAEFDTATPGGDLHAGRTETALLLGLDPQRVRSELAEAGDTRPWPELAGRLQREGVRAVSANGVLGDPRQATRDEGLRLLESLAERCAVALDALLAPAAGRA